MNFFTFISHVVSLQSKQPLFFLGVHSFGDWNHLQQQLSFPTLESGDPLSPPPKEAKKKKRNEIWY
jgi:hypothetical protein